MSTRKDREAVKKARAEALAIILSLEHRTYDDGAIGASVILMHAHEHVSMRVRWSDETR
jgi:hypothetical protein